MDAIGADIVYFCLIDVYKRQDGSYLRVKDISLSYNIRCRQFKKWGISRVQPYFTASNLLTWTRCV